MEIRSVGRSGLKVSMLALGCNNFGMTLDADGVRQLVHKALDLGITFFDVADFYGGDTKGDGEILLARALGARRRDVVVATKFGVPMGTDWILRGGGSRDYIMHAVEQSLRRLETDYIDLYQLHLPDETTPIEETLRALEDLIRQGKVRYIGHSNLAAWQVADAAWSARTHNLTPFVSSQNQYSVLSRGAEAELIPACRKHGLGLLAYLPLEGGALTGKYASASDLPEGSRFEAWSRVSAGAQVDWFLNERSLDLIAQLGSLARESGATILDLALGWLVSRSGVTSVITGASRPEQLEANVKAVQWRPSDDQQARIDAINRPPRISLFADVLAKDLQRRGYRQ